MLVTRERFMCGGDVPWQTRDGHPGNVGACPTDLCRCNNLFALTNWQDHLL